LIRRRTAPTRSWDASERLSRQATHEFFNVPAAYTTSPQRVGSLRGNAAQCIDRFLAKQVDSEALSRAQAGIEKMADRQLTREQLLREKLVKELSDLRGRLKADPNADPLVWLIRDQFACGQRPLRDHPKFQDQNGKPLRPLPPEAGPEVIAWVRRICGLGIRSVICLMHSKELRHYENLNDISGGLLALYRDQGLGVHHFPWADHAHARNSEERQALVEKIHKIKQEACAAYLELPKPVFLHCSAGIDRSAPVAAHIVCSKA
jgi:hypothetical protein